MTIQFPHIFRVMKKKLEMQIKQKEEMGEVLHEVDFNQLKIENQQYLEKIDEKNQELLRLKLMAGNTLQVTRRRCACGSFASLNSALLLSIL